MEYKITTKVSLDIKTYAEEAVDDIASRILDTLNADYGGDAAETCFEVIFVDTLDALIKEAEERRKLFVNKIEKYSLGSNVEKMR